MNWNEATAIASVIGGLLMLRGGLSLIWQAEDQMLRHLGWATVLLVVGVIGRGAFWDLGPLLVADGWRDIVLSLGGLRINSTFHLMTLIAVWHFMRMVKLLIPAEDRKDWPLWRAPFYPRGLCVERVVVLRKREDKR